MFLRKHAVRVGAVAAVGVAGITAIAAVLEQWVIAAVTGAGAFVVAVGLLLVISRRQYRAVTRSREATLKALEALREDLGRERASRPDTGQLRVVVERAGATLAGTSAALARAESALEDARSFQTEVTSSLAGLQEKLVDIRKRQTEKSAQLRSALLTDQQALHQLLSTFKPTEPLPVLAGWAMDPAGLAWMTRHIARTQPELVFECGSGTSTLWSAMALRANGRGRLIALDHKPEFAARTREMLALHGLSEWAEVVDAPLMEVDTPRGRFHWYDVKQVEADGIDLLLVDGPPKAIGPYARYPALPVIGDRLAAHAFVVADDMHRVDEQETVKLWLEEIHGLTPLPTVIPDVALMEYRRR